MNPAIPVFVISLPTETKRRAMISEHLESRGLPFQFFDAIDGRQMDVIKHQNYNSPRRRRAHGRDLTGGELGCLLSHQAIYQKIIDENLPFALVLEDDVRLGEDFPNVLEKLTHHTDIFDIVRFLGSPKVARGKHRKIKPLDEKHHLVRLRTAPGGAHATLVTRKGAQKLLKALQKNAFPIDTLMGRGWETGIQSLSVQPGLATQDLEMESAIGDTRFNKDIKLQGWERKLFPLTRGAFKIGEAIGKAQIYWGNAWRDKACGSK